MEDHQSKKKIRNWGEYNKSLVKRGEIIWEMLEGGVEALYHSGPYKQGGKQQYTPYMYEFLLTIKTLLRYSWRATVGFAYQLLKNRYPDREISIPDYAHANRIAGRMDLKIKIYAQAKEGQGMVIALDSTGISVYNTSEWHRRKYGKENKHKEHDQWQKVHVAFDVDHRQVVTAVVTHSRQNDCTMAPSLLRCIKGSVAKVLGDKAYDTYSMHRCIHDLKAVPCIPPMSKGKTQQERGPQIPPKEYLAERDKVISFTRGYKAFEEGLREWKKESGYHQRSLVEALFHRMKTILGAGFAHKTPSARRNEVITKINILNYFAKQTRLVYA